MDGITFRNVSRLSQIEEELESPDDELCKLTIKEETTPVMSKSTSSGASSPIYYSADALKNKEEALAKEAVKKISDKYDSLERVQNYIDGQSQYGPPPPPPEICEQQPEDSCSNTTDSNKDTDDTVFNNVALELSEQDLYQIEMFYRSHGTTVYVCQGLTNLYFGSAKQDGTGEKWELYRTGVPVLVMDTGDSRRKRKLKIVLAEKGSGFELWKDSIDHLTNYRAPSAQFHTLFLSNDHSRLAGLSYDDLAAAADFMSTLQKWTSDPSDEMLNGGKKKKKFKKPKIKFKAPKKTDISQPCCFVHVTKLDPSDKVHYAGILTPSNTSVVQQNHIVERTSSIRK